MAKLNGDSASVEQVILNVVSQNTEAISELSKTMTDIRVSLRGLQSEVEGHNKVMEQMAKSIDEIKATNEDLRELRSQLDVHENQGTESRRRINERLDEQGRRISELEKYKKKSEEEIEKVDNKSKVDLVKIGVQLFVYIFGGGGAAAFFLFLFENYVKNKP